MADSISSQSFYMGAGYLDSKMTAPKFADVIDASSEYYIPTAYRFKGLTVTVSQLTDDLNKSADVWLVGMTSDSSWRLKSISPLTNVSDLDKIPYTLTYVGLQVIVTKGGEDLKTMSTYWVTKKASNVVTWELMETGKKCECEELSGAVKVLQEQVGSLSEALSSIDDLNEKIDNLNTGQIIYIKEPQYVYVNNSGETVYTKDKDEAQEAVGDNYTTLNPGAYIGGNTSGDTVTIEKIITSTESIGVELLDYDKD